MVISHATIATTLGVYCVALLLEGFSTLQLSSGWTLLDNRNDDGSNGTRGSEDPGPRSGSSTWMDSEGRAWLFGGRGPNPASPSSNTTKLWSDLWSYHLASDTWKLHIVDGEIGNKSSAEIQFFTSGRELAAMCGFKSTSSDNGKGSTTLVIFGGRMTSSLHQQHMMATDELLVLKHNQSHWQIIDAISASSLGTKWPPPRYDALDWCDSDAGELSIVGGRSNEETPLIDAWTLDLSTLKWQSVDPPVTACAWTAVSQSSQLPPLAGTSLCCSNCSGCNQTTKEVVASPPPPLQLALIWRVARDGSLFIMCDNETVTAIENLISPAPPIDDPNIQLWYKPGKYVADNTSDHKTNANLSTISIQKTVATPTAEIGKLQWHLVAESERGAQTWPGTHRHGGTCTDFAGNLWLFAGQSQLGGHRYLNNDVWSYDVSSATWIKVELPTESTSEPDQRHLAAVWCYGDAMLVYGGLICDDDVASSSLTTCIRGDLWVLNFSTASTAQRRHLPPQEAPQHHPKRRLPISIKAATTTEHNLTRNIQENASNHSSPTPTSTNEIQTTTMSSQKSSWLAGNRIPTEAPQAANERNNRPSNVYITTKPSTETVVESLLVTKAASIFVPTSIFVPLTQPPAVLQSSNKAFNGTSGASLTLDSGSVLHSEIPGPHSVVNHPTRQEIPEGTDHGAYGSAIFFGISLSMFAIFGVVLFFRRCVSCPPRENSLLKEAPPVRYTVIPDDNYSI